jgi:hypothetical protein
VDRGPCTAERRCDLGRIVHFFAIAAEHLGETAERHIAQQIADIAVV